MRMDKAQSFVAGFICALGLAFMFGYGATMASAAGEPRIFNGFYVGSSAVLIDTVLDEDDMSSDDATAIATQQSIKAYVDGRFASGLTDTVAFNDGDTNAHEVNVQDGLITSWSITPP